MAERMIWTDEANEAIRAGRAAGLTWQAIADGLGLKRQTVIDHGRGRLAAAGGPVRVRQPEPDPFDDPERGPLPAGHPVTWGILTAGTVLEGSPWPGRER